MGRKSNKQKQEELELKVYFYNSKLNETFYKLMRRSVVTKIGEETPCGWFLSKGEKIQNDYGLDLYGRYHDVDCYYMIIEGKTGQLISCGDTYEEAIEELHTNIKKVGDINKQIELDVSLRGLSPLYAEEPILEVEIDPLYKYACDKKAIYDGI